MRFGSELARVFSDVGVGVALRPAWMVWPTAAAAALPAPWARLCPGAAAAGHAAPQVCSPSGAESQGRW